MLELEKVKKNWNKTISNEVTTNFENYGKQILKTNHNSSTATKNPLKEIAPDSDQNMKNLIARNAKKRQSEKVLSHINRKASRALNNPEAVDDNDHNDT